MWIYIRGELCYTPLDLYVRLQHFQVKLEIGKIVKD